jgi:hypothetical protein
MRQYSKLFCLGLQIWISEMIQYYPELEVVELVQDGPRFFWDHLLLVNYIVCIFLLQVAEKLQQKDS